MTGGGDRNDGKETVGMTRSVMPDGCYRASGIIFSLPTHLPLDYGKMDSR